MKLNVNKNIISGNNLLPFYFLPHALNISLFMIAVVMGRTCPACSSGYVKLQIFLENKTIFTFRKMLFCKACFSESVSVPQRTSGGLSRQAGTEGSTRM